MTHYNHCELWFTNPAQPQFYTPQYLYKKVNGVKQTYVVWGPKPKDYQAGSVSYATSSDSSVTYGGQISAEISELVGVSGYRETANGSGQEEAISENLILPWALEENYNAYPQRQLRYRRVTKIYRTYNVAGFRGSYNFWTDSSPESDIIWKKVPDWQAPPSHSTSPPTPE